MKKFTLFLTMFLALSGFSVAQIIEDFEAPKYELFGSSNGDMSSYAIVPNPDPSGINKSSTVLKFVRDKDLSYAGFRGPVIPFYNDGSVYVHAKVWKPRISSMSFCFLTYYYTQLYGVNPMNPQTKTNEWEEMVFNFPSKRTASVFEFWVEDMDSKALTEDIIIYVDDIYMNHDPAVGSAPEIVFADYEHIPLNLMLGGAEDNSSMTVSPNPNMDSSDVNISSNVAKFVRDKDGVPWGGFWSTLPDSIDVTTNKYMHVKVWKPRISPVKFKIEGGAAGNLEVVSKYPQTKINEWEDLVFDLSSKTGTYPTIAFMPDFEDPLTLTEDMVIYFDDIVLNNDPFPRQVSELTINIDVTDAGLTSGQKVFILGNFGGIYGGWVTDGNPACEMTDPDNDSIYSIKMKLPDELFAFQFYKGTKGAWEQDFGPSNREYEVKGNTEVTYKWQIGGLKITAEDPKTQEFNIDMKNAGLTSGQKVYISGNFGGIYGNWAEPGTNPLNELTDADGDDVFSTTLKLPNGDYQFKFFKGEGWSGGEWPGDPNRVFKVNGSKNIKFEWGSQGIKYSIDGFNLITDGHFNSVNPLLEAWADINGADNNFSEVNNGIMVITNNTAGVYNYVGVFQVLNDYGKLLQNDSIYFLKFDAWASTEKVNRLIFEDQNTLLGISRDFDAINGASEWDINFTTEKITYTRTFTAKNIKSNSRFFFRIYSGEIKGVVYIDDIYLFKMSDLKKYGVQVSEINVTGEGGATSITTDKGTLPMNAQVLPENAWIKNVEWSVINGTGNAVINADGLLTAVTDGKVTVVATALDGSNVSDSIEINISNQTRPGFPIDFENISDFAWNVFKNGALCPGQLSMAVNPGKSSTNPSENVLKFIINSDAETYSGASSSAFGLLEFTCYDYIINMSIKKPMKSVVGIKVEQSTNGGPDTLITVNSTAINVWQKLKFNFSACAGYSYQKITIYPDIRDTRTEQAIVYLDNIELVKSSTTACTEIISNRNNIVQVYPNPVNDELNVYLNSANVRLTIYNSLGSKMEEINATDTHTKIDVRHYAQGVYFLKINNDTVVKFVK